MDDFLKKMAHLRSDFRDVQQQIDAKVDHMLKMLASMQLQLQMQGMTKGEEIGDDFSFVEPQLHNLPCLPLRRTEGESEILPSNQHRSPSSHDSCAAQLESEGFVGVLNHTPISTTMAKSRFGEPKSEVLADLKLDKPNSVFEILPKQPLVVYLCSAVIESSKNSGARKVFGELTMRELNPLQAITVFVDLGKVIYIYKKENNVNNEATSASCIVGFEMEDIENIMGFDPGGDSRVFGECSYKKLFYIEELVLLLSCLNSPRNHSKSYKPKYFVEEVILGFDVTYLHRSWLRVKATRRPHERNTRLENMCRRIWNLAWRKKQLGIEESDGRSSNFQQNDRRYRYQNLVHGISIQVLEELSFVIRSTCETTSQLLEDNIFYNLPSYKWWKDGSVSWTIILKEYIIYENRDIMKSLLEGMRDTLRYTNIFNVMIDGYVKLGDMRLAKWLFDMMLDWNSYSGNIMLVEYHLGNCCIKYAGFGVAEGHFVVSIKANYIDSIVLVESVFAAEVKKLQVEHFKLIEMVILEPFEQYHVCDWIKMFDGLLSKLPSQFRYMSCEDTTHSRGKNCCGNGRVRVWRFGRGRVIGGAEFKSRKASQLGHLNILFQNLTMEISSLANICTLLRSSPRGNPIAENLGITLWECLRDFIIPTTLTDDISNLVLFGLRGIIGAMLKPLFHEFCVGAIWSFFMTYKLYDVEKVGEPPVSHVTDELDSHLLHSAASNFRFPHSLCLSANLSPSAGHSLLLPKKKKKMYKEQVHG